MQFADVSEIAALIDHTLLKADATATDVVNICRQAVQHRFASVCVNPCWVPLVSKELMGSTVRTCSVAGFPLGSNRTSIKISEAQQAVEEGAREVDMVMNVGALLSGSSPFDEMSAMADLLHTHGAILKVIIETCLLTDEQKVAACEGAKRSGADFVKTSTGFSTSGATEADVALMRKTVGPGMGVKASGGIRTLDALTRMVKAGATRIGSSSGAQILAEFSGKEVGTGGGGSY